MVSQHEARVSLDHVVSNPPYVTHVSDVQAIPFVKIYTCGGLRMEVLQQPADSREQALYGPPSPPSVVGRGGVPAQMLLKHLISAPSHYRSLDWLQEHWYTSDESRVVTRLDTKASYLRGMLCPTYLQGEQREICRRQLVSHVSSSEESGSGYRLGAYPLIWIDVDALDWNVQQACRMERYNDNALPFWERAYHLASRGYYLPEEAYSDWVKPRRSAVTGALRQSVHALTQLYLAHHGERGQAEVLRLLRDYLLQFPTDEDALCSLMQLLGHQERFQEIKQMVERTQRYFEEEGETLDAHTLDLWKYLQAKQIANQRRGIHPPTINRKSNTEGESIYEAFIGTIAEGVAEGITKVLAGLERQEKRSLH